MGFFANRPPPNLPLAPREYKDDWLNNLTRVLRLYFSQQDAVQQINVANININTETLPTEADVATLRVGDVYRDATADNVLKVKV